MSVTEYRFFESLGEISYKLWTDLKKSTIKRHLVQLEHWCPIKSLEHPYVSSNDYPVPSVQKAFQMSKIEQ